MIASASISRKANPDKLGAIRFRFRLTLALGVLFAFMLAGCSSQNFSPAPLASRSYYAAPTQVSRTTRTEVASWYGPGFAGRRTSSGEVYNPEGLTAASKTLPLGSHVRVTNPDTGKSVVVKINDRGPFVRGRSLDLSHGAARQIGLTSAGVGRVQVTPTATSTPSATWNTSSYAENSVTARAPQCELRLVSDKHYIAQSRPPSLSFALIAPNGLESNRRLARERPPSILSPARGLWRST